MEKVDLRPAYPISTDAGSKETVASAMRKIKLETERIYRLFTDSSNLSADEINKILGSLEEFNESIDAIKGNIADQIKEINGTVTSSQQEALDQIKNLGDALAALSETLSHTLTLSVDGVDYKYNGLVDQKVEILVFDKGKLVFPNGNKFWIE